MSIHQTSRRNGENRNNPSRNNSSRSNALAERMARQALGEVSPDDAASGALAVADAPPSNAFSSSALTSSALAIPSSTDLVTLPLGEVTPSSGGYTVIMAERSQVLRNPAYGRSDLRADDPEILDMRRSIRDYGVLEPLLGRWNPLHVGRNGHSTYPIELIAGYKRDFCTELEGIDTYPMVVREMDDVEAASISLIENLQRSDPNAADLGAKFQHLRGVMDTALGKHLHALEEIQPARKDGRGIGGIIRKMSESQYERMLETYVAPDWIGLIIERARRENKVARVELEDIAARVGMSSSAITQKMAIAQLPEDVRAKVRGKNITDTEARALLPLREAEKQSRLAREMSRRRALGKPMTEGEVRERVKTMGGRVVVVTAPASSPGESEVVEGEVVENHTGSSASSPTPTESNSDESKADDQRDIREQKESERALNAALSAPAPAQPTQVAAPLGDPSLAVAACATIFKKGLAAPGDEVLKQLSTALLWFESVPADERAALYQRAIAPQIGKVLSARDAFWAPIQAGLDALEAAAKTS